MTPTRFAPSIARRRKPLAACFATLFALAAPDAIASTWVVNSCADHGSNTLRDVVTNVAQSGDTVDLSQLSCSLISLNTGAITITQTSLDLQGPPHSHITISGKYNGTKENDRIFNHTGTGTVGFHYLDIVFGNLAPASGSAYGGGCIYSKGSVVLTGTQVLSCAAKAPTGLVGYGGGVFAKGDLIALNSVISGNTVSGSVGGTGGGAAAHGKLTLANSTVSGNSAASFTGGAFARGGALILDSTVSGNTAPTIGGLYVAASSATDALEITDSTISGNVASGSSGAFSGVVGGVISYVPTTVQNSTIAFNTAVGTSTPGGHYAPGLALSANTQSPASIAVNLQSSILSNNTYGTSEADFSIAQKPGHTFTITSANSLVRASIGPQPAPTVSTACPLLGPLRDNGGLTQTHALMSRSPAIDAGNNAAGLTGDQRGAAFPRVSGAAADIGAYEVQQADIIFNNGFDGCP
ncbi:choice-of-anchor Q domain-containing protein [Dokdonella soli]|uniref:CSLREA domain-containing protein n=1 Tax=Dokdonella soli TaxID=529810 RepID=A0ABN1IXT2_9GAMM